MKRRALASVALGAAVLLGTTGCNMLAPQATTIHYSAAEGMNVPDATAPVAVRNAFFVVNDADHSQANLVAVFVNNSSEAASVTVQYDGAGGTLTFAPHEARSYGIDGQNLTVTGDFNLGGTAKTTFQTNDAEPVTVDLPVLNGDLDYLESAVPAPAETPAE